MQFISIVRRKSEEFPPEAFTKELQVKEWGVIREFYMQGRVRQVWRRADGSGVVSLWEANSAEEVRAGFEKLPFAQAGMIELEAVIALEPYPGLGAER